MIRGNERFHLADQMNFKLTNLAQLH